MRRDPRALCAARALLVALGLLGTACATLIYHPYDEERGTGHLERQVAETAYYVEFIGERGRVSVDAARGYAARRCAELALARGRRSFALRDAHGDEQSSLYRHEAAGRASCYGAGLGQLGLTSCALRPGEVRYELRADRVRFRALCELAPPAGAHGTQDARAYLAAHGGR